MHKVFKVSGRFIVLEILEELQQFFCGFRLFQLLLSPHVIPD